ncbi:MAG: molybdate ABC transporter substrate-binding protein [Acidobacteria bacterium]|nr:molybdate ABC transporter substrate-binding protein [Acidobacteriota bacterium]
MLNRWLLLWAALLAIAACTQNPTLKVTEPPVTIYVAAASDLTHAFTEIGSCLGASQSIKVVFAFGSSGLLSRQIEQGAPFDLFASASGGFVDRLESQGLVLHGSRQIFAQGRLVIWQLQDAATPVNSLEDLATPAIRRIAIANPEHAPYGLAARQALESKKLWEGVKEKIVFGENVAQAFQFAQTGNVDAAIVAQSLATRPQGRAIPVEPAAHAPIDQTLCILRRSQQPELCRRFVEFLSSPQGREILQRYGFIVR